MPELNQDFIFIIPSYKPENILLSIAESIEKLNIITLIIDDGSGASFEWIFDTLEKKNNFIILKHYHNKGKGAALKTAFEFILLNYSNCKGVITLDADGQHQISDVIKVLNVLKDKPTNLVLGSRSFTGKVPLRSKFGNYLTKFVFKLFVGFYLSDTQTGLRGIPVYFLPILLHIKSNRYEFELAMLIHAKEMHMEHTEVKIDTIYEKGNSNSHFNPLLDSMKIYFTFIRYISSSVIVTLIDYILLSILMYLTKNVLFSVVFSRLIAGFIQFFISRKFVFRDRKSNLLAPVKFLILLTINTFIVSVAIKAIQSSFEINIIAAKVAIEFVLFISSFYLQKFFIFRHKSNFRKYKIM